MKKAGTIIAISSIILIVIVAAVTISLSGVKNGGHNYVKLEVNPKVEFVTNNKDKVESIYAINEDAKTLLASEEFIGLSIEDACVKFIDLCAQSNYIDVDGKENPIKLTVVSGLTQMLDIKIYRAINEHLKNNEIYSNLIENTKTLDTLKEAKKLGVCVHKFELMESVSRLEGTELNELKKLNEKQLIAKILKAHNENKAEPTEEEITNKTKLIDFNREKYNAHKNKITNETKREFSENLKKFRKETDGDLERNFDKTYENWYETHLAE